jgi:hypothetical protein
MQTIRFHVLCKVKWKEATKEIGNKKATGDDDVPGEKPQAKNAATIAQSALSHIQRR